VYRALEVIWHTLLWLLLILQGFVAAISPFNFTAIGANLASAPALMARLCVLGICH
jgi:acyl-CoA reductase-like NAD-dependent aldehyde dehydrogenase